MVQGRLYDVDVACPKLLQTGFDADEHRLRIVAGVIALNRSRIFSRVIVRGELHSNTS